MNATMTSKKIEVALKQIETLQDRKTEIASQWMGRGERATAEACEAIDDQIVALYGEIDAIEDGKETTTVRSENRTATKTSIWDAMETYVTLSVFTSALQGVLGLICK